MNTRQQMGQITRAIEEDLAVVTDPALRADLEMIRDAMQEAEAGFLADDPNGISIHEAFKLAQEVYPTSMPLIRDVHQSFRFFFWEDPMQAVILPESQKADAFPECKPEDKILKFVNGTTREGFHAKVSDMADTVEVLQALQDSKQTIVELNECTTAYLNKQDGRWFIRFKCRSPRAIKILHLTLAAYANLYAFASTFQHEPAPEEKKVEDKPVAVGCNKLAGAPMQPKDI